MGDADVRKAFVGGGCTPERDADDNLPAPRSPRCTAHPRHAPTPERPDRRAHTARFRASRLRGSPPGPGPGSSKFLYAFECWHLRKEELTAEEEGRRLARLGLRGSLPPTPTLHPTLHA